MTEAIRLIIPTYNRPTYLSRALKYYEDGDVDFPITVADSSTHDQYAQNADCIKSSSLSITHDRYPETINPHYKFAEARKKVAETYALLASDDDFIVPRAIQEARRILDARPDVVLVHGAYMAFRADKASQSFVSYPIYGHATLKSESPLARIEKHISRYFPTHFALMRTTAAHKAYAALVDNNIDPMLWGELLPSFLMPIFGKEIVMDRLWAVRDSNATGKHTWPTLQELQASGRYEAPYRAMKAVFARELAPYTSDPEMFVDRMLTLYPKTDSAAAYLRCY